MMDDEMKAETYWEPLVLGPALAMERSPGCKKGRRKKRKRRKKTPGP
jgi:hypothetical protein